MPMLEFATPEKKKKDPKEMLGKLIMPMAQKMLETKSKDKKNNLMGGN